ncbi:MAG: ATP-binding protein [Nitrospirota bacterium]|nr:ATP-binding protein [Nitrospirota bacterium]
MTKAAHFQVDSRLASLLGETYSSTEDALKELVDNAWDADATEVSITLPAPNTSDPIVIMDNGTGMTEREVRAEYLFVANDRRSRKGDRTSGKNRLVKGRKGIGKFAGLMAAELMSLQTNARGNTTTITIDKKKLIEAGKDIERVPIDVISTPCNADLCGTVITLSHLNQALNFPMPEKFRELLIHDYGRETDFAIRVNKKPLDIEDLSGPTITHEVTLPGIGPVKLRFTVSDGRKQIKRSGIVVRVAGKSIGKPRFFGLDKSDDFPAKLLGKIYGEIEVDGLANDITADWAAIVDNSKGFDVVKEWVVPHLRAEVKKVYGQEIHLAQARLKQKIQKRLEALPEYKREFADRAIKRILQKFYNESEDRVEPIVSVVLDAMERDEYRAVLENIDEASHTDVAHLAAALEEFGLLETAIMSRQLSQRLNFLDYVDALIADPATLENQVHKAVENSLWMIGTEYSLMSSNKTLRRVVDEYLGQKYKGSDPSDRPDLLLVNNVLSRHLLIEFKRPSHEIGLNDYQQATKYRHEISAHISSQIDVLIIGGTKGATVSAQYKEPGVEIVTYNDILSGARKQLDWLIQELKRS